MEDPHDTVEDPHDTMENPQDIATGFVDAWNRKDAEGIAELFVEDADFVNVVGLWWRTREHIRRAHHEGFTRIFRHSTMEARDVTVRNLGQDAAVVHCAWTLTGQDSLAGRDVGRRRGIISFTAARTPGQGWRAVAAQNTDRINGAETLIATGDSLEGADYRGTDYRQRS